MIYFSNLVRDVKNELSHFLVSKICNGLPRNITKFAYDMVWGMLSSGSCKVSMIGRRLFREGYTNDREPHYKEPHGT